ncbi:ribonuclease H-like domain-containing protein [Salisediminibacterium halotolerans]|uniref:ribonuclease H-like domain-containing protein n=1 Tax=Salisediminibacterium halotolerans TaxID=517425 RepID=UPI000EAF64B9|nr:ribonuclease H-like domain-containing protein [Salisediminibacterium halotolerans]RLJ74083.1 hypothetical protein BCL39_1368 [Actinophytocola xinjiangensis]RPE87824.1 hypothetical protein EDD67_1563 [Salisediminibacterium halotolerans]TWG34920.1 hypothetical protein BCL52_1365 [Salisediminibacterium halotolerans]GEL07893.1 hypothetical protein SHA02_13090 [Salisediminibacterium halotolerans]
MSMKAKLQRMKTHLAAEDDADGEESVSGNTEKSSPQTRTDRAAEDAFKQLGFIPFSAAGEVSFRKKVFYPEQAEPGEKTAYERLNDMRSFWSQHSSSHALSFGNVPVQNLLFFDTETTGLSQGAGNRIFLIGYARVFPDGTEVTQHILRGPADETAFLTGFLDDFHADDVIVSYNGKSFDWPQVKSRHAFMYRTLPELPQTAHIDLLHAARRLWKHELPSCRLAVVEEYKLNNPRMSDIPGRLAPILYFDYLHENDPFQLQGVISHHDQDVRSLITLYDHMSRLLFFPEKSLPSAEEHLQIGRWFVKESWLSNAEDHLFSAAEKGGRYAAGAYRELGYLYKKLKRPEQAKTMFIQAIEKTREPRADLWAEAAKIAEHSDKDLQNALYLAREGLKEAEKTRIHKEKFRDDFEKRIDRLEEKVKRL